MQQFEETEAALAKEVTQLEALVESVEIQPVGKLAHLVEVGFQIGSKDFLPLATYNDLTFDCMTRKYVFEFQTKLSADDIYRLEKRMRDQVHENFSLFNEIQPAYLSLNLGRPVDPFAQTSV
jgi:arginine decarboxylase-like protein